MRHSFEGQSPLTSPFVFDDALSRLIRIKARRLARRRGFSRHEEEDLAQELFVKALQVQSNYDPSLGTPEAFLSAVLDNHASNLARQRQAKKRHCPGQISLQTRVGRAGDVAIELEQTITQRELDARLGRESRSDQERAEHTLDARVILERVPREEMRKPIERLQSESAAAAARASGVPLSTFRGWLRSLRPLLGGE
jgi:DNA-directed RNA polymerase specialized sigma24 family protein